MLGVGLSVTVVWLFDRKCERPGWLQSKQHMVADCVEKSKMPARHAVSSNYKPISFTSVRADGTGGRGGKWMPRDDEQQHDARGDEHDACADEHNARADAGADEHDAGADEHDARAHQHDARAHQHDARADDYAGPDTSALSRRRQLESTLGRVWERLPLLQAAILHA